MHDLAASDTHTWCAQWSPEQSRTDTWLKTDVTMQHIFSYRCCTFAEDRAMFAFPRYLGTESAWRAWQHHIWSGTIVSSPADTGTFGIQDSLTHRKGLASKMSPACVLLHCLRQSIWLVGDIAASRTVLAKGAWPTLGCVILIRLCLPLLHIP